MSSSQPEGAAARRAPRRTPRWGSKRALCVALCFAPQAQAQDFALPMLIPEDEPKASKPVEPLPPDDSLQRYRAVRVSPAPSIDGKLDDPAWEQAPADNRFFSRLSVPYGQPAKEPTEVRIVYDERNLYVAFRCGYSEPGPRDEAMPESELRAAQYSEAVSVQIDPRVDRSNGYSFQVTRLGFKVDVQMSNNGEVLNWEWRGVWSAATHVEGDEWTAELAIPWATLELDGRDDDFEVGINFRRKVSITESSVWSLMPPSFQYYTPISYFGRLEGLSEVRPDQQLVLLPYVAATSWPVGITPLTLRDFSSTGGRVTPYAGVSGWLRPGKGVRLDFTVNPDFSLVTPDSAQARLDRFEIVYPEVRPFFVNDRAVFEVGEPKFQLFYSRRVGQRGTYHPAVTGPRVVVPLLGGLKLLGRSGGTQVGLMNVTTSQLRNPNGLAGLGRDDVDDNVSVGRVVHSFGERTHIGLIALNRASRFGLSAHRVYGGDAEVSGFNDRLFVSGFAARSDTQGARSGTVAQGKVQFLSEQFQAHASHVYVGANYDASLGFFEQTGVNESEVYAAFLPLVNADLVRSVRLAGRVNRRSRVWGELVFDEKRVEAVADLMNWGEVLIAATDRKDRVADDPIFGQQSLGGGRIRLPAGDYESFITEFTFRSPPQFLLEYELGWTQGDYFGGQRYTPRVSVGFNAGLFNTRTLYELYWIRTQGVSLLEHRLSAQLRYIPNQQWVVACIFEANTFDPYAKAQLSAVYRFGMLSSVSFVLAQWGPTPKAALERLRVEGTVVFTYGFSAF